jgi:AcrR family transcriptional regulator
MHVKRSGEARTVAGVEGRTTKAEQGEATRARLLRVARDLFAERGYAAVGTEEIVRTAEVTRGALYHHFRDKKDLFRAVHEQLEGELVESLTGRIAGIHDARELLATGVRSFLDACTDPALGQISLIDAPSVLGWAEWREVDARYGMGLVRMGLEAAMDQGVMPRQDPEPLAHLLLAALGEAALLITGAPDPQAARREVEGPLLALLDGLQTGQVT